MWRVDYNSMDLMNVIFGDSPVTCFDDDIVVTKFKIGRIDYLYNLELRDEDDLLL